MDDEHPWPMTALNDQLLALGITPGSILLVHSAFSRIKPIEGGPAGLIAALEDAVGEEGTLVMPSMTDDDDHPFDPAVTPCISLGIVADTFWRQPGVRRSDNPHAFAAKGPAADYITSPHVVEIPHGPDSPVGRVHELGGLVLLLGIGHDANTTVHLAEFLGGVRYRLPHHVTIELEGKPVRVDYREIDHCCQKFALLDQWLDAEGLQQRGRVGSGEARLMAAGDVVKTVVPRLKEDETVFLHPLGHDAECDQARASLAVMDLQPTLEGSLIRLRPLRAEDFPELFAVAADREIWAQHPNWDRYKEEVFRDFFRVAMESGGALVVIDKADGRIIGSSRYYGYDQELSEVEIGWTFLARKYWGGVYNGEMKQLMLEHAFRYVKRVIFIIGPTNIRSQRAIEKIGGVRAGSRPNEAGEERVIYEITADRRKELP